MNLYNILKKSFFTEVSSIFLPIFFQGVINASDLLTLIGVAKS